MTVAERGAIMAPALETELATYEEHRDELLAVAEGKYVPIKGREVAGVFESKADAITLGYRDFGNVPFLVKRVDRVETPAQFATPLVAI
jgi:hypothetical protein